MLGLLEVLVILGLRGVGLEEAWGCRLSRLKFQGFEVLEVLLGWGV